MTLSAGCKTTAMGIMPHIDVERAFELALSLDIPFWPQLPRVSFYEDMYAQSAHGFPGVVVDPQGERVSFSLSRFEEELADYSERMANPETFALTEDYSAVYHRFLDENLEGYAAIRGQLTGPVSFGFKVAGRTRTLSSGWMSPGWAGCSPVCRGTTTSRPERTTWNSSRDSKASRHCTSAPT